MTGSATEARCNAIVGDCSHLPSVDALADMLGEPLQLCFGGALSAAKLGKGDVVHISVSHCTLGQLIVALVSDMREPAVTERGIHWQCRGVMLQGGLFSFREFQGSESWGKEVGAWLCVVP